MEFHLGFGKGSLANDSYKDLFSMDGFEEMIQFMPSKYMYVDDTLFSMYIDGSVGKVPVLGVIGLGEDGYRTVLALQPGDKKSAPTWREWQRTTTE